jgi:CSLREA domain-containing protein
VKHHAPARRTVSAPGIFIAVVATAWVVAATGVAWARSPGLAFPAAGGSSASVIHGFGSLTDYTYTVDSTGDGFDTTNGDHLCIASTGGCTLRAAIQQDNFNCGAVNATSTTIDFSIGTGGQTIAPLTALPTIACPTTVDGTKVSLSSYRGHPVWLTFGATWCAACKAEAPDIEAALICRTDAGVEYFLVPIDACYELAGRMRLHWRGFDGGSEARESIEAFLANVRSRARAYRQETADG